MFSINLGVRAINRSKNATLNNVCSCLVENRRGRAHGEMYMPKEMYRMRGPTKANKHWSPRYKRLRELKVIKLNLPDYQKYRKQDDEYEKMRDYLKEMGLPPLRTSGLELPYFMSSSMQVMDPYVPSDMLDFLERTKQWGKDRLQTRLSSKESMALKEIKKVEANFDKATFAETALEIYKAAHRALVKRDEETLHEKVTELAFTHMWDELKLKTLRWKFVKSLEAPKVVQMRANSGNEDNMLYGQVTVRFHSQQILAVYDQFGRLFMGSEDVARDVLEFVVYEKHLSHAYGKWRMHAKIQLPDSTPAPRVHRTYKVYRDKEGEEKSYKYAPEMKKDTDEEEKKEGDEKSKNETTPTPALAT